MKNFRHFNYDVGNCHCIIVVFNRFTLFIVTLRTEKSKFAHIFFTKIYILIIVTLNVVIDLIQ